MKLNDMGGCGCNDLTGPSRCDAELPDNPQCAPNYHFGMLLGVEDFRAEQGFHLGQLRRHQRLLHGVGVVAGFAVDFRPEGLELRVTPGHAIDALGRDLQLEVAQCVSLPLWWLAHRGEEAFADIDTPDDATLDLDLLLCYASCLGSAVPAIAEPCAGDAADVAYSRVCETATLRLVRTPAADVQAEPPFHLLQMWLGQAGPRLDADGQPLPADQWLIDRYHALLALPVADQAAARAALQAEVIARAVAEASPERPAVDATLVLDAGTPDGALCLPLARLRGVHLKLDPGGWTAAVADIALGQRPTLLPTSLLQWLLLAAPEPVAAGPVVIASGASLAGDVLSLVFSQPLAPASVTAAAFAVSEFDAATGWVPFTVQTVGYDDSDPARPTVALGLDRAPSGSRVRASVIGSGSTPLLGASFVPAGALHADGDGRALTTTIVRG